MPHETPPVRFHVSLDASSLADSVAFYRELLAVEPDKLEARYARFVTDAPPLVLSLIERDPGVEGDPAARAGRRAPGASHFGLRFESESDLASARARLAETGRVEREEPDARCCFARQDKVWLTDPDGNEWEVYRVLGDLTVTGASASGCCG